MGWIYQASVWFFPVLTAVILHEVAHGWVADRLGDPTPRWMGRLSLNPIKHIDPLGTILVPGLLLLFNAPFLFGYAKPVPVNFAQLHHPRRDMILVAAAGPLMNLLLAFLSAALLVRLSAEQGYLFDVLQASLMLNLVLCMFNLLPLPPLDGGRIAVGLLPSPLAAWLAAVEPYAFPLLIVLLLLGWVQALVGRMVVEVGNAVLRFVM